MWGVMLLFFFYQFIARSSFPTILTEQFMQHFGIDAAGVGILASCYYWTYTFMQVPAGIIADKIGVRVTATAAVVVCASGILLFTATHNYIVAGIGEMMIGFGSSFVFVSSLKIITDWFPPKDAPSKISYTMSVATLGPVLGGPIVSHLVKSTSWLTVMEIFGALGFLLAILVWASVRNKETHASHQKESIALTKSLKMIVSSGELWILALFTMMIYAPLSAFGDLWGVSFMKKAYNLDSRMASIASNMLYIGVVSGAPIFPVLAKRWNSCRKPMILGISMAALCMGSVIYITPPLKITFFLLFLTGASSSVMMSYTLAMALFPKSIGGTVSGFVNMASMISGVVLMPTIGCLIKTSWNGAIENGIDLYSLHDFKIGLTALFIFLLAGIGLSLMAKDKTPEEAVGKD
jgi:MFS family permease